MGENPRNSVLFANVLKNYRSTSLLACKQNLLVLCSNGRAKARVATGRVTSTWMARGQVARSRVARTEVAMGPQDRGQLARGSPCGKRTTRPREEAKRYCFVLRTYIDGGLGVKKLHID